MQSFRTAHPDYLGGDRLLNFSILTTNMDSFLEGLKITIIASLIALLGSFILGTLLAVMRIARLNLLTGWGRHMLKLFVIYQFWLSCFLHIWLVTLAG